MFALVRYDEVGITEGPLAVQGPFNTAAEAQEYGRATYYTRGEYDVFEIEAPDTARDGAQC